MIIKEHIVIDNEDWNEEFIKQYIKLINDLKISKQIKNPCSKNHTKATYIKDVIPSII